MEQQKLHLQRQIKFYTTGRTSSEARKTLDKINPLAFDWPPPIFDIVPNKGWLFCAQSIISADSSFAKKVKQANFYCSKQKKIDKLPYFAQINSQKYKSGKGPAQLPTKKHALNRTLNTISSFLVQKYKGAELSPNKTNTTINSSEIPLANKAININLKRRDAVDKSIDPSLGSFDGIISKYYWPISLAKSLKSHSKSPKSKSMFKPKRYFRRKFSKHGSPTTKSDYPKAMDKGTGPGMRTRLKHQIMTMRAKTKGRMWLMLL